MVVLLAPRARTLPGGLSGLFYLKMHMNALDGAHNVPVSDLFHGFRRPRVQSTRPRPPFIDISCAESIEHRNSQQEY